MPRYDISIRVAATRYTVTEAKPKLEPKALFLRICGLFCEPHGLRVQAYVTAIFSCQLIFREVREDKKTEDHWKGVHNWTVANIKGKADIIYVVTLDFDWKRKADGTVVEQTAVCLTCNAVVKTSGCITNSIHAQNKRFISSHLCLYTWNKILLPLYFVSVSM